MFLDLNDNMKLVFELIKQKEENKEFISSVQALTLNKEKPYSGLAGKYGLFMSDEWWNNIRLRKIKTKLIRGKIVRLYEAGQDKTGANNSFDLILPNGRIWDESIYTLNDEDKILFKLGSEVNIFYVFDEMKKQPDNGKICYSNIVIEMAVSYKSIEENTISKTKKFFSFWKK